MLADDRESLAELLEVHDRSKDGRILDRVKETRRFVMSTAGRHLFEWWMYAAAELRPLKVIVSAVIVSRALSHQPLGPFAATLAPISAALKQAARRFIGSHRH